MFLLILEQRESRKEGNVAKEVSRRGQRRQRHERGEIEGATIAVRSLQTCLQVEEKKEVVEKSGKDGSVRKVAS